MLMTDPWRTCSSAELAAVRAAVDRERPARSLRAAGARLPVTEKQTAPAGGPRVPLVLSLRGRSHVIRGGSAARVQTRAGPHPGRRRPRSRGCCSSAFIPVAMKHLASACEKRKP